MSLTAVATPPPLALQLRPAHRQAEAIGGGEGQLIVAYAGEDAGEDRARIIGRGGEDGMGDHRLQLGGVHDDRRVASLGGWHAGELGGVHATQRRLARLAADFQPVGAGRAERYLALWQRADELGQQARGDGGGSLLLCLGGDAAGDADLQVGGGEADAVALGGDEDRAEDRQGRACRDGMADGREALGEIGLFAGELHGGRLLWPVVFCLCYSRRGGGVRKTRRTSGYRASGCWLQCTQGQSVIPNMPARRPIAGPARRSLGSPLYATRALYYNEVDKHPSRSE